MKESSLSWFHQARGASLKKPPGDAVQFGERRAKSRQEEEKQIKVRERKRRQIRFQK